MGVEQTVFEIEPSTKHISALYRAVFVVIDKSRDYVMHSCTKEQGEKGSKSDKLSFFDGFCYVFAVDDDSANRRHCC